MMRKRGLKLPRERTFTGPASVWKRLAAFVTDLLIINLVLFFPFKRIIQRSIPSFSSYSEAYGFLSSNQSYTTTLTVVSLIMAIFAVLYFALLENKIGQTPGKMLFDIFILSDTKNAGAFQFFVRSIFIIPVFPFVLLWVMDPLFMLFTKTNQRLSEILSRTRTIEKYVIR